MSLTNTTLPLAKASAYLPIIFEVTSSRDNSASLSVTSVSNSTGNATFHVASNSQFKTGNVVTLSGFAGVTTYNGVFDIIADTSTTFTVTIAYVSTDTGTATITNNNFKVKGELYVFDQTKYSITGITNLGLGLVEVTTSTVHGYAVDDIIFIRATTNYNNRFVITAVTSTTFTIGVTYISSQTGNVQRATKIGTKYQNAISVNGVSTYRFSFAGMLQTVLSYQLFTTYPSTVQNDIPNCIKAYVVLFTEVYDSADGTTGEHSTLLSAWKYVHNVALQSEEAQDVTTLYELGSPSKKFLTDSPAIQQIRLGEEVQLSFLGKSQTSYKFAYEQFDYSGTSLGQTFSTAFSLVDDRGIICVNQNNVLSASISRVDVWITNTSNIQVSEKKTFVMVSNSVPTYRRFYFFNQRSGFDCFTFGAAAKVTRTRKKNRFTKLRPLTYTSMDRGTTTLSASANQVSEIFSRMLTNEEAVWMQQFFDSNMVFLLQSEGATSFIPVDVYDDAQPEANDVGAPLTLKATYEKANRIILQVN